MLNLRPYQIDLYDRAKALLRAGKRTLLIQSPTGSGKTCLIAHILGNAARKGYRSWFLCHRRELIEQSVKTLIESAGLSVGIVASGFPGNRFEPIQVCSVQTLAHRSHLLPDPHLIVIDECHHTAAKTWSDLIGRYPSAVIIGLTATAERLDGTGLGKWFEEIVTGPSVAELIKDGWLSPYRLFAPGAPDLSGVHMVAGDYNKKELAVAMESTAVTGDALSHYQKHANGKRAVIFMWSVASSIAIADQFKQAGISAAHLDGGLDLTTRKAVVDGFRSGEIQVISNCQILTEGFDVPGIEAVFLLRPTRSLGLYLQMVGRGLRPAPGKDHALIFDHSSLCRMHGLPDDERQWSLEGHRKKSREPEECPVKQCPKCYAMLHSYAVDCQWCHHRFKSMPRPMEQRDGELSEVDIESVKYFQKQQRKEEERACKTLDELIALGRSRNYEKPEGWAKHVLERRQAWRQGGAIQRQDDKTKKMLGGLWDEAAELARGAR